jgi:hypothetical protein
MYTRISNHLHFRICIYKIMKNRKNVRDDERKTGMRKPRNKKAGNNV